MRNFGFADYDEVSPRRHQRQDERGRRRRWALTSLESLRRLHRRQPPQLQALPGAALAGVPGVELIAYDDAERCNYQYVVLEVDGVALALSAATSCSRVLLGRERAGPPLLLSRAATAWSPTGRCFPHAGMLLPETERLAGRVLCLPTGTAIGAEEVEKVCRTLTFILENGPAISKELHERALQPVAAA